jgi:hypothetical protein
MTRVWIAGLTVLLACGCSGSSAPSAAQPASSAPPPKSATGSSASCLLGKHQPAHPPDKRDRDVLRAQGFGWLTDAVHVDGVTVLSGNMLHKADDHEMATFFLRQHHLVASDRVPRGRSHFAAVICKVGPASVTTGYLVNAAVTGHLSPKCPPVHWALVRWRISSGQVRPLDPIPHSQGCWPPARHA